MRHIDSEIVTVTERPDNLRTGSSGPQEIPVRMSHLESREILTFSMEYIRLWVAGQAEGVQSINQSIFYSANIPDEARLSGTTAKSLFNSKRGLLIFPVSWRLSTTVSRTKLLYVSVNYITPCMPGWCMHVQFKRISYVNAFLRGTTTWFWVWTFFSFRFCWGRIN